jgi:hypothetical protein
MKGFNPTWCDWVKAFVQGGNVEIKVNDHLGQYFETKKGPLSWLLSFSLVFALLD